MSEGTKRPATDWSDVMSPERIRRIMRMRLIDNTLMKAVFDKCPDAAELLLHAILGRTDIRVKDVRSEQELHNTIYHEIRIDIDAEDGKGIRYDIEIQRKKDGAEPERALYNMSYLVNQGLGKGVPYKNLSQRYVIFICELDFLKLRKPVSYFGWRDENGRLLTDREQIVYVNGQYRDKETLLGRVMHDMFCRRTRDMLNPILADRVKHFKYTDDGRKTMCDFYVEGRAEGRAEGLNTAKRDIAVSLKAQNVDYGVISRSTGLSIEEIENLPTEAA